MERDRERFAGDLDLDRLRDTFPRRLRAKL